MTVTAPARFVHGFGFDPAYGMDLAALRAVTPPEPPAGFADFWRARATDARRVDPAPRLGVATTHGDHVVHDVVHRSTGDVVIGGWLVRPKNGPISRGLVVGHGYGGRDAPDFTMAFPETAVLFPCLRGLSRSARPDLSPNPMWHVLHDIHDRDAYVLGGCVDDLWTSISALRALCPELPSRVGLSGESFGGGIAALAAPWDERVARLELILPTFGHHALRRGLPMTGSGAAITHFAERHPGAMATLAWFDAAAAARFVDVPVLASLALFDPAVPPPGQFAIFNALRKDAELVTFDAGHFAYPDEAVQRRRRLDRARAFFEAT